MYVDVIVFYCVVLVFEGFNMVLSFYFLEILYNKLMMKEFDDFLMWVIISKFVIFIFLFLYSNILLVLLYVFVIRVL